jgi:hypothetical protein
LIEKVREGVTVHRERCEKNEREMGLLFCVPIEEVEWEKEREIESEQIDSCSSPLLSCFDTRVVVETIGR